VQEQTSAAITPQKSGPQDCFALATHSDPIHNRNPSVLATITASAQIRKKRDGFGQARKETSKPPLLRESESTFIVERNGGYATHPRSVFCPFALFFLLPPAPCYALLGPGGSAPPRLLPLHFARIPSALRCAEDGWRVGYWKEKSSQPGR